jgi:exopolysaccharide biosynthesis polyprenyl glycosylphosphotransferase
MAVRVAEIAQRHPEHGIRIVGFVDDEPLGLPPGTPPVLGGLDELEFHLRRGGVKRLIVAFPNSLDDRAMADLLKLSTPHGIRVEVVPRLWELAGHDTGLGALGNLTLIEMTPIRPHIVRTAVKRGFDIMAAGLGLLVTAPVLAAVAVAVRIDSPGPALFRQTRIGRDGRPFEILKFRSMYVDADAGDGAAGRALEADAGALGLDTPVSDLVAELKREHDPRITAVGRFIRRTSLDELPQLWNVLVGDMSVIGPRPLRPFEARSLTAWQQQRHLVRPGITGIWQVLGRSDVQWNERMEMDYSYARNCSLRQDVRVLARTLTVVLSGKGSR